MFDINEPIQIIGLDIDASNPLFVAEALQKATEWNEKMRLQNRYDRAIEKIARIQKELEDKIAFCENEANGTVNDTHCRIAISFYKRLLEIIKEG